MPNIVAKKLTFGNPTTVELVDSNEQLMSELSYVWVQILTPGGDTIDLRGQILGGQLHLKEDRYPKEVKDAEAKIRDDADGSMQGRSVWVAVMISRVAPGIDSIRSYAVSLGDNFGVSQLGVDERRGSHRIELGTVVKLTLC